MRKRALGDCSMSTSMDDSETLVNRDGHIEPSLRKFMRMKVKIKPFGPDKDTCALSAPKRGKTYSKGANSLSLYLFTTNTCAELSEGPNGSVCPMAMIRIKFNLIEGLRM